jgi:hypothetical protein
MTRGFTKPGEIPLKPQAPKDRGLKRRTSVNGVIGSAQYGAGGRCNACDAPLSRYNPDDTCRLCWERSKRIIA